MADVKRLQIRRDTLADWVAVNPILLEGEVGLIIENGRISSLKIGDGVSSFAQLPQLTLLEAVFGGYVSRQDLSASLRDYATMQYVDSEIGKILGGASGAYDTLKEIEDILKNDTTGLAALLEEIGTKADTSVVDALASRVSQNESNIADHTNKITANTGNIDSTIRRVAANEADLEQLNQTVDKIYEEYVTSKDIPTKTSQLYDDIGYALAVNIKALAGLDIVTKDYIADAAVTTSKIKDGSITSDKLSTAIQQKLSWIPSTTDDLPEGSSKLYFTNARAVAAVDGASLNSLKVGGYGVSENIQALIQSAADVSGEMSKINVRIDGLDGDIERIDGYCDEFNASIGNLESSVRTNTSDIAGLKTRLDNLDLSYADKGEFDDLFENVGILADQVSELEEAVGGLNVGDYIKNNGSADSLSITSINTTTIRTQGDYIRQSGSSEVWKLSTYGSGNNPIFSKPLYVQEGTSYNLLATQSWANSNFHPLTTVDSAPTSGSNNLVTSGGVYSWVTGQDYLSKYGTAADSAKLGGVNASNYLLSSTAASTYLTLSGGIVSSAFSIIGKTTNDSFFQIRNSTFGGVLFYGGIGEGEAVRIEAASGEGSWLGRILRLWQSGDVEVQGKLMTFNGDRYIHSGNISSYAVTSTTLNDFPRLNGTSPSGASATGTWGINISGSANYATSAGRAARITGTATGNYIRVDGGNWGSTEVLSNKYNTAYGDYLYLGVAGAASNNASLLLLQNGNVVTSGGIYLPNNSDLAWENSDGTVNYIAMYVSDTNNLIIGNDIATAGYDTYLSGNNIRLRYGTSRAVGVYLNSSGNVTIGGSDLAGTDYKLFVHGNTKFISNANTLKLYTRISESNIQIGRTTANYTGGYNGGLTYGEDDTILGYIAGVYNEKDNNETHFFYGGHKGSAVLNIKNGNVGIGTSNPNTKLHVVGSAKIEGALSSYGITATTTAATDAAFTHYVGSTKLWWVSSYNNCANFNTALYVQSGSSPIKVATVNDLSSYLPKAGGKISGSLTFSSTSGSHIMGNSNSEIIFQPSNDTGSANIPLKIAKTGSSTFTMYCDESEVYDLGTSSYKWNILYCRSASQSSDATLKNILGNVELTTAQIANAPAVHFTWKNGGAKDVGTIAQYWKDVLPEVVSGEEGSYGMNYAVLGVVSSIILARNIETHEQRIARLEKEISDLQKELNALVNNE